LVQKAIEYITFPNRESRSSYVANRFRDYLMGTVLDVGCDEAPLRELLPGAEYTGIDLVGEANVHLDLDKCTALPFHCGEFSCVIAIDVLEHLDHLHRIFDEIVRVSNRFVIVSLPNCWRDARRPLERGKGSVGHYGLPIESPRDRHKWFFNVSQAQQFIEGQAKKHNLSIIEMFATEKPKQDIVRWIRRIRYPGQRYANRYIQTLWTVYEHKSLEMGSDRGNKSPTLSHPGR